MTGPIGSAYPGTPVVLAFLGLFAAVLFRTALVQRSRRRGVPDPRDRIAYVLVIAMAVLFILVVIWSIWSHA